MNAREAIVQALTSVQGLAPSLSMPDVPVAGAAWPVWQDTSFTTGKLTRLAVPTYMVTCLLPADYNPETVELADSLVDQVAAALGPLGVVDLAQPVLLSFDQGQTMPAIQVRFTPRQR